MKDCPHLNPDGTFKDGFDGCVLHMMSDCGGGYDEESAKKICGAIAQQVGASTMKVAEVLQARDAMVKAGEIKAGAAADSTAKPQPRREDGTFHSADTATREADEASSRAKTPEQHAEAARLHEVAAKLHDEAGNPDKAKVHRQKALAHREHAALRAASAPAANAKFAAFEAANAQNAFAPAPDAAEKYRTGFMAMAGGIQTLNLSCNVDGVAEPLTLTLNVNAAGANALQRQLELVNRNPAYRAFNCFDHKGSKGETAASSWPLKFFWHPEKKAIYEIAEPSADGARAVSEKKYRGFSLTFFTNAKVSRRPLIEGGGLFIKPGDPGSPENPAEIICPDDIPGNEANYVNMGTLTNKPACSHNEPFFASASAVAKTNLPPAVPAARLAGARTSKFNHRKKMNTETTKLDAAALQDRKKQLEQRIEMLAAENTDVAKQQIEAAENELTLVEKDLMLAAAMEQIEAFKQKEKAELTARAKQAVADMIEAQQIPALDKELQAQWQKDFEANPALIDRIVAKRGGAAARRLTPSPLGVEAGRSNGAGIELGFSVPAEMKQLMLLCSRNASIRVNPGLTQSEVTAAYEEKARLALQAGLLYKKSLAPRIGEWKEIPPRELARCVGLEFSAASSFNRRSFEAADVLDPNNQFQTLVGTLVLQQTLPLFAYEYPELLNMFTDFSATPGLYKETVMTRVVNIPAVVNYNEQLGADGRPIGFEVASPGSTVDAPLVLSQYIAVPFVVGQATLSATPRRLFDEIAPAGIKAIAGYFVGMVTKLLTPNIFNAYAQVTAPDANGVVTVPVAYASYVKSLQDWDVTDLDKLDAILTQNKVPSSDRGILLNPDYFAKTRNAQRLLFAYAATADNPQLTDSELPKTISGFKPYKAAYLPANVPFFTFQKAAIMLKSRLPVDYRDAVNAMVPGSITTVTDPDTGISVALVQRVDLVGNYAEWRPEVQLGANVGDVRGGLCGAQP